MKRGGIKARSSNKTEHLIEKLYKHDCSIKDDHLREILASGDAVIPYLEEILIKTLQKKTDASKVPLTGTEWFVVIHALYLLAHLKSEKSLDLILDFLSQDQKDLDYWLHDLLDEDLWEIPYLLGQNQLDKLQSFIMNQKNNMFSRLAVVIALIQIALHYRNKSQEITKIFQALLLLKNEDTDFIGLVASELMDWRNDELEKFIVKALKTYNVYEGIIDIDEVEWMYQNKKNRVIAPLNLYARYEHFRQQSYFRSSSQDKVEKVIKLRKLDKSIKIE